jgi:predicted ATPase/DNA-binding SARP family transcriptional activator
MEFRILGRLEIAGDTGPVVLRGQKRRGLAALLVVHAGQHLEVERIVDALWDAPNAPGAARTVQAYVSQLRRTIDDPTCSISGESGGYVFVAPADSIDAARFEQLVRRAASLDDPSARLRLLDGALDLWRGTPLDEFDGDWARAERIRLEALRLQAVEQHVEARLELGYHRDMLGELESFVAAQPLDERLWRHLIVAYYRSGRQADALRAYQRVRGTLADELGIEPGPELVALERRVLDQDESLLWVGSHGTGLPKRELPSGTLTFLFTDLGDSTRAWEAHPDEMHACVARHHKITREAIDGHAGHFVKSLGDGVMAVFESAPNAIAAAVDIQLRLDAEDWPVPIAARMGLHTGVARAEDGDYHAPVVNRASRAAAAAHPGQVLVTAATAALAEEWTLDDLGEHELRGLPATRLYQVRAPGLRARFPAPTAPHVVELPNPTTSFIVRDREIVSVAELLDSHRLVTITGAGGCGKTRLAIEVAYRVGGQRRDGARFVDLASVIDDAQVVDAAIDAVGLTGAAFDDDPIERLVACLRERELLLVLDNCEHLLDASAELAMAVTARTTTVSVLATSREPLAIEGEQVYRVPSFASADGISLFAERAAEARADFAVDDTNRGAIADICERLDGIPLAIELAAATVAHLAPAQILERIGDRFRLLTGGRRRVQRHQTLTAALDWSHELLSPSEQVVFRRLAVFAASFSLDAAEAVVDHPDTVERLGSLVGKSLVHVLTDGDRLRYRLLETVRLYAEAKLVDAGEATACRTRQRDWVRSWLEAKPLEERWFGDVDYLAAESANIRMAIEWSAANDDLEALGSIASGVDWSRSEAWRDGFRACRRAWPGPHIGSELELQVCMAMWWLGPIAASPSLEFGDVAVASIPVAADAKRPMHALALAGHGRNLTVPAIRDGDERAAARVVELADAGVALSESFSGPWQKVCCYLAGMAYTGLEQLERAHALFERGAAVDPSGPAYVQLQTALEGYLALTTLLLGDADEALVVARRADARMKAIPTAAVVPYWHHSRDMALIVTLGEAGEQGAARQLLRRYRELQRHNDWKYGTHSVALLGAALAAQRGDWEVASRLLAFGEPGVARSPADWVLNRFTLDRVRDALPRTRRRALREEGRAMSEGDAIALALA